MREVYFINARGTIIEILKMHPIFHIENSFIQRALQCDSFSENDPFYIDIDSISFHTILTYLNCHQEANSGEDYNAEKYLKLLEKKIEENPTILYAMNKLSILDDLTNKTKWSCSLDNCLDITKIWDEISGFTYIVNMLCENKYKKIYFCINKYGKGDTNNILLKNNIPILDIKIHDKNNNTINLNLGYQNLTDHLGGLPGGDAAYLGDSGDFFFNSLYVVLLGGTQQVDD